MYTISSVFNLRKNPNILRTTISFRYAVKNICCITYCRFVEKYVFENMISAIIFGAKYCDI